MVWHIKRSVLWFRKRVWGSLGPGLIAGAADDDPSGISTYSVAGATFGYLPLWTALVSFPLMASVQMMCARLGMVTGEGQWLRWDDVSGILTLGGTILGTSREKPHRMEIGGQVRDMTPAIARTRN